MHAYAYTPAKSIVGRSHCCWKQRALLTCRYKGADYLVTANEGDARPGPPELPGEELHGLQRPLGSPTSAYQFVCKYRLPVDGFNELFGVVYELLAMGDAMSLAKPLSAMQVAVAVA